MMREELLRNICTFVQENHPTSLWDHNIRNNGNNHLPLARDAFINCLPVMSVLKIVDACNKPVLHSSILKMVATPRSVS